MINKIENLENLFNKINNDVLIEGLVCFHLHCNIAVTGNDELLKALINGK